MSALSGITSIKVKLGALVVVSAAVTGLVAAAGAAAGVPVWLTLPVTVLVALAVTQLLAVGMVAPLREMTGAARTMATGDYSVRVATQNVDEVGELARAFNQMATDLAHVDEERRDLVATVSHELRTPVAAITAQLENLADGVVEPDPRALGEVLSTAERLGDLLNDLLALSRVEAGVAVLDRTPVALRSLVVECVAEVTAAGRSAGFAVEVDEDLRVPGDASRLRQLLVNVLDNAARHTPAGQDVRVLAGSCDDGWWLEVVDRGQGVAPEARERVFERFGTDATGGGTGLGLAVSRWVARLHGGSLVFVDPEPGTTGARLRLDVPSDAEVRVRAAAPAAATAPVVAPVAAPGAPVISPTHGLPPYPVPAVAPAAAVAGPSVTSRWPENRPAGDLRPVLGAGTVGVLAGAVMTFSGPGLTWVAVLLASGLCAWLAASRRDDRWTLLCTGLATLLVAMMAVRANPALSMLGVFVAAGTFLAGVTGARTFRGMLLAGIAWPASGLRGLPWLGRSLGGVGFRGRVPAVVRTVALSVVAVGVFALLFSAADAVFATWVGRLVPTWELDEVVARGFVAVGVFGLTLTAAYLARNPAQVDPDDRTVRRAQHRWEWLVPVLLVDAVFAFFIVTQAAVVLGGHDYLRSEAGLSYGEYVHQGFGQLVVATLLALVVVWAAARHAGRTAADRRWLLASLGLLCMLTLCVAAAALGRMWLYQDAYGWTTLRVVVIVFEAWVCLVVLAVAVLGARGSGRLVPRLALVTAALAVLGLLVANPDAWVAGRNLDRYDAVDELDMEYLASLSHDAAPVVADRLPVDVASCVVEWAGWAEATGGDDPGWTWGRDVGTRAAREVLDRSEGEPRTETCREVAVRLGSSVPYSG